MPGVVEVKWYNTSTETSTGDFQYCCDQDANALTSVTLNGTPTNETINQQNEVTAVGASNLWNDKNGNTLEDAGGNHYAYNAGNQIVAVPRPRRTRPQKGPALCRRGTRVTKAVCTSSAGRAWPSSTPSEGSPADRAGLRPGAVLAHIVASCGRLDNSRETTIFTAMPMMAGITPASWVRWAAELHQPSPVDRSSLIQTDGVGRKRPVSFQGRRVAATLRP